MPVESSGQQKKNVTVKSYLAWTLTPDSESPKESYCTYYEYQTAPKGRKVQTDIRNTQELIKHYVLYTENNEQILMTQLKISLFGEIKKKINTSMPYSWYITW